MYIRAGSIVPHGPAIQYADEQPDATISLTVYPGMAHTRTFAVEIFSRLGQCLVSYQGDPVTVRDTDIRVTLND